MAQGPALKSAVTGTHLWLVVNQYRLVDQTIVGGHVGFGFSFDTIQPHYVPNSLPHILDRHPHHHKSLFLSFIPLISLG